MSMNTCLCMCVHMHIMHSHIPQHAAYAQASAVCHHNCFDKVTNRATLPKPQSISSEQGLSNFIVFVNGRDNGSSRDGRRRSGFLVFFTLIFICFSSHFVLISPYLHSASTQILCARCIYVRSTICPIRVCSHKRDQAYTCMYT